MKKDTFYHALKVVATQCTGCTHCMNVCPTSAIRIRHGKASINEAACTDCGMCLKSCPRHAIIVAQDDFNRIYDFPFRVIMLPTVFIGQFSEDISEEQIFSALHQLGFNYVIEVDKATGLLMEACMYYVNPHGSEWKAYVRFPHGNRMNLASNCIGGVKCDVSPELLTYIRQQVEKMRPAVAEIRDIYATNSMVLGRTRGIGLLPHDDAVRLGVVGPVARGSGIAHDVRKDSPYAAYMDMDFNVPVYDGCCIHSRTMVRLDEVMESFGIIEQCCTRMPDGPVTAPKRQIHVAEACARSEAPRGEVFYYIRTNGTDMPERLKWRVPSYMNWEALSVMMRDCAVADVALITNSIDPCVSCTER